MTGVVWTLEGAPLRNLDAMLRGEERTYTVRTGQHGELQFPDVVAGQYSLRIWNGLYQGALEVAREEHTDLTLAHVEFPTGSRIAATLEVGRVGTADVLDGNDSLSRLCDLGVLDGSTCLTQSFSVSGSVMHSEGENLLNTSLELDGAKGVFTARLREEGVLGFPRIPAGRYSVKVMGLWSGGVDVAGEGNISLTMEHPEYPTTEPSVTAELSVGAAE